MPTHSSVAYTVEYSSGAAFNIERLHEYVKELNPAAKSGLNDC